MIKFTEDEYDTTIHEMVTNVRRPRKSTMTPPGISTPRVPTTTTSQTTATSSKLNTTISENDEASEDCEVKIKRKESDLNDTVPVALQHTRPPWRHTPFQCILYPRAARVDIASQHSGG